MAGKPLIGITADNVENTAASGRYESAIVYSRCIAEAGGVPILLPHEVQLAAEYVQRCDGLLLTGGTDPKMEAFGRITHRMARPMDEGRQRFEAALLDALDRRSDRPVLGVCLGMQLMALHHGGDLHQYLPEVIQRPEAHQGDRRHGIELAAKDSRLGAGVSALTVVSAHRQAVSDAGRLRVVARAPDGVIEAVDDPKRPFYLGVQWHPERGGEDALSRGLIRRLVQASASAT